MERYKTIRSQELQTFTPEKQHNSSQNSLPKEAADSLSIDIFSSSDWEDLELQILLHETAECIYPSACYHQKAGASGVAYLSPVKLINVQN